MNPLRSYKGRSTEPGRHHESRISRPQASSFGPDHFRYPIRRPAEAGLAHPDDMIASHFRELLDLLIPMSGNRRVMIDGYGLLKDPGTIHPILPDRENSAPEPLDLYEPRIGYIRRALESILGLVELESGGRPVRVDGFRLKDPAAWLGPSGGASDILAHAASRCNVNCRFCYNRGTSPALKPKKRDSDEEYREIRRRIEHYVPEGRLAVFPDMASPCEMLAHPCISEILFQLREKTPELFRIATNGAALTEEMLDILSAVKPVRLDISLNSASPGRRKWLMRDKKPETALGAPKRLEQRGIPYSLVIVPWPFPSPEVMLADLTKTLEWADNHRPMFIQISLPGYTRHSLPYAHHFDESVWRKVKRRVQDMRHHMTCPVVLRPGLYEEYDDPEHVDHAALVGVIAGSPLDKAGVCRGDRISGINGIRVKNRRQARSLLTMLHQGDLGKTHLHVLRNAEEVHIPVDLHAWAYPYAPAAATHLGAVFSSSGIPSSWMDHLLQVIERRFAKTILLLTSRLVRPSIVTMIAKSPGLAGVHFHLWVPENRYFGGNIFMGDLITAEDVIVSVRHFIASEKVTPELVVLPASPFHMSGWGRDLTGRVYLDIERHLGIPVELIPCDPLFD
ncbi:MAG: radical SAM protein [Desulfobacterales bacterium]